MFLETDLNFINAFFEDPKVYLIFVVLGIWSLIWKGFALWKSARNSQKNWFIALLAINTVGILEIIYIFYFSKPKNQQKP